MFYLNVCLKKLFEIFRDGMDAGLLVDTEGSAGGAMAAAQAGFGVHGELAVVALFIVYRSKTELKIHLIAHLCDRLAERLIDSRSASAKVKEIYAVCNSFLYSIVQSPCQRVVFSLCIALTIRSRPVRMIERGIARFRRI